MKTDNKQDQNFSAERFDPKWYQEEFPDVHLSGIEPMDHWLRIGRRLGRPKNPETAESQPVESDAHDSKSIIKGETSFISVSKGEADLVRGSEYFDADWYLETYGDVGLMGVDPVAHYLHLGHRMGRNPSPGFSGSGYLAANADVRRAGLNPLVHYLRAGKRDGRRAIAISETPHVRPGVACQRKLERRKGNWDWPAHTALVQQLEQMPYRRSQDKVFVVMPTYNRAHMIKCDKIRIGADTSEFRADHRRRSEHRQYRVCCGQFQG